MFFCKYEKGFNQNVPRLLTKSFSRANYRSTHSFFDRDSKLMSSSGCSMYVCVWAHVEGDAVHLEGVAFQRVLPVKRSLCVCVCVAGGAVVGNRPEWI